MEKEETVEAFNERSEFQVLVPNRMEETSTVRMTLGEVKKAMSDKRYNLMMNSFETKYVIDMSLEEDSGLFLYDISYKTRYADDAFFLNKKTLLYTLRVKFASSTDNQALVLLDTMNRLLPM